ncbi:acetylglutamate kinase [Devriesea agamarum]|uniref:acetylglutamate kinase n=1 Tax=Devriesea agamarum TaxID=472569 RepID=UPI0009FC822A|nr:acetylglutamate kinase [Devriesea agamarum]
MTDDHPTTSLSSAQAPSSQSLRGLDEDTLRRAAADRPRALPDNTREQARIKSEVLLEALPWIQRYSGAIVVVKYGGHAMVDDDLKRAFAADMVFMRQVGLRPVVVHGGGPQITSMLKRVGLDSQFRGGLRVTTDETMEIVRMVLMGQVGRELVGLINAHGPYALGMSGEDAQLLSARRTGAVIDGDEVDIGLVGEVVDVNCAALMDVLDAGRIPVVSSIAPEVDERGVPQGPVLNVNADTAAAGLAKALQAEKLLILTDVEGLYAKWPDPSSLIPEITVSELRALLPTLTEGMIPKMTALLNAVESGVRTAAAIDGRIPHAVLLEIFTSHGIGTMVKGDDYV